MVAAEIAIYLFLASSAQLQLLVLTPIILLVILALILKALPNINNGPWLISIATLISLLDIFFKTQGHPGNLGWFGLLIIGLFSTGWIAKKLIKTYDELAGTNLSFRAYWMLSVTTKFLAIVVLVLNVRTILYTIGCYTDFPLSHCSNPFLVILTISSHFFIPTAIRSLTKSSRNPIFRFMVNLLGAFCAGYSVSDILFPQQHPRDLDFELEPEL